MNIDIKLRDTEGDQAQPLLVWDSVWDIENNEADWQMASAGGVNRGGLEASHMLPSAIIQCLFTWARVEQYELGKYDGNDLKGWWGDSVDREGYEKPMGSKLWLLLRSPLTDDVGRQAVIYAHEALQVLISQGVVVRFDIEHVIDRRRNMLGLIIDGYGKDGAKIYSQKFTRIWQQEFS